MKVRVLIKNIYHSKTYSGHHKSVYGMKDCIPKRNYCIKALNFA